MAAALGMTAALACRGLTDPALPDGAEAFAPPPVYARWWAMTEACSGVTRPLDAVRFYRVPNARTVPVRAHGDVAGYWSAGSNRIVLAGFVVEDGGVVRHEMLHALVRGAGHPRGAFLGRCGGVVDCSDDCVTEAGPAPAPDPAAVPVGVDALEVRAELSPAAPSPEVDGGLFTFTVVVRNPAPYPVVVVPPPPPIASFPPYPVGFQFEIVGEPGRRGVEGAASVADPMGAGFAPGEVRRRVYDLSLSAAVRGFGEAPGRGYNVALGPGRYALVGGYGSPYGGRRADSVVVAFRP